MADKKDEKKPLTWRKILTYGLIALAALAVIGGLAMYVYSSAKQGKSVTFGTPESITVTTTKKSV